MGIYHIFIVSKAGGLIFNYDHKVGTCYSIPSSRVEIVFSAKVEIVFP